MILIFTWWPFSSVTSPAESLEPHPLAYSVVTLRARAFPRAVVLWRLDDHILGLL
jgi:hypothetical protein